MKESIKKCDFLNEIRHQYLSEQPYIDVIIDNSDVFDYVLTNDEINYENLTEMSPSCLDCDDTILSLQDEFGFLLNDKYEYLLTLDGEFLAYH